MSDLLRQGDIPRFLNQELKNRKPAQKNDDNRSNVDSSSFLRIESRKTTDSSSSARVEPRKPREPLTPSYDPNAYAPDLGTNRGEKRKEESSETPSPSLVLAMGLFPMLNGDVRSNRRTIVGTICGSSRTRVRHFGSSTRTCCATSSPK